MADESGYSVGNLKIAFNTLDQTSDGFKALANNLKSVVKLINNISTADLGKFSANIKQITKDFSPLLSKFSKATQGIQVFNDVAKQVGIKNVSKVVADLEEIQRATHNATESQATLNAGIENSTGNVQNETNALNNLNEELKKVSVLRQQLIQQSPTTLVSNVEETTKQLKKAEIELDKIKKQFMVISEEGNLSKNSNEAKKLSQEIPQREQLVAELKKQLSIQQGLVVEQYNAQNAARKQRIAYLEAALAMGTAGNQAREFKKELEQLRKEDGQIGKKSGLSKFLGQVKRIAIYRVIRAGLKEITSAAKEGIGAYAQFDSSINKTMSQLTTSATVIKTSFGATLIPILSAVTPIIQQISVGFANMANVINASMSTTGKYTKINTDRLLAYNKAANLFDFDKFRSLNSGGDASGLFSTENVEDLNKELGATAVNYKLIYDIIRNIGETLKNVFGIVSQVFEAASPIITVVLAIADGLLYVVQGVTWLLDKSGLLTPVLGAILGYLTLIGATKIFTSLKSGAIVKWLGSVISLLKEDFSGTLKMIGSDFVKLISSTKALAAGIGALIASVSYLAMNWNDLNNTQKLWIPLGSAIIGILIGVATAAILSITAIKEALKLNPAAIAKASITAALFATAAGVAIGTAISTSKNAVKVPQLANGGMPDKGSMFVAGEAGAEFVYNMPSGQSGVANVQQIAQAEYQGTMAALNDWWKSARNDIGGDVYLDGEKIYQSVNRTASKHGKRFSNV